MNKINDLTKKIDNLGLFENIYKDKRVLVTGHTGFKGSWLSYWLTRMGAQVWGYSLNPQTDPNHWDILNNAHENTLLKSNRDIRGDIRNFENLHELVCDIKPDIIFHLAAQALVLTSYEDPITTYASNLMGSLNLYEAARKSKTCKVIISITSDKVYQNDDQKHAFSEDDHLGGYDPYSSSKACVEIMTSSYRNSFLNIAKYKLEHNLLLATTRAGNVIGGGDWAKNRLIPDIVRATINSEKVTLRNPTSTRPWQHVLDPISGYLQLGQNLLAEKHTFSGAWNFGPKNETSWSVLEVIQALKTRWPKVEYLSNANTSQLHEAKTLVLNCQKSSELLSWIPIWDTKESLEKTVDWYRDYYAENKINTEENLLQFISTAQRKGAVWT